MFFSDVYVLYSYLLRGRILHKHTRTVRVDCIYRNVVNFEVNNLIACVTPHCH